MFNCDMIMNSQALIRNNTHILCTHCTFPLMVTSCRATVQYYILYLDISAVKIGNISIRAPNSFIPPLIQPPPLSNNH